jgi:hypothetical protein
MESFLSSFIFAQQISPMFLKTIDAETLAKLIRWGEMAKRELNQRKKNTKSTNSSNDETESLNGDETESLNGDEAESLNRDETESLNRDETESLNGDETESLNRDEAESPDKSGPSNGDGMGVTSEGQRCSLGEKGCQKSAPAVCNPADRYYGRWVNNLRCGTYEIYEGWLTFRPQQGLILYHGSETFTEGEPYDSPVWYGAYENSVLYAKSVEKGYMNNFRLIKSPRLLVLTDSENLQRLLSMVDAKTAKAISRVTGVGLENLQARNYSFGCVYQDKSSTEFSRWSSRREDTIMANAICDLPGIDGYAQPTVKYCSAGIPYRFGEPLSNVDTFYGEIVICNSRNFLERITSQAIACFDRDACDLDLQQAIQVESDYLRQHPPSQKKSPSNKTKQVEVPSFSPSIPSSSYPNINNLQQVVSIDRLPLERPVDLSATDSKQQEILLTEMIQLSQQTPTLYIFEPPIGETLCFYTREGNEWYVISLSSLDKVYEEVAIDIIETHPGIPYIKSEYALLHLLNNFHDGRVEISVMAWQLEAQSKEIDIEVHTLAILTDISCNE